MPWLSSPFSIGCAKHPQTEDVYYSKGQLLYRWNQALNTHERLFTNPLYNFYFEFTCPIIDAKRNRWLQVGGTSMQWIDLNDLTQRQLAITDPAFQADRDVGTEAAGLVHDLDNDRYLALCNTGKVYAINPTTAVPTLLCSIPTVPGPVAPSPHWNGWNNRAAFFPSLNGIVAVPWYGDDAYFMPTK